MYPKLINNLYIHEENNRILYFNPEAPDWITINTKYKNIFELFDGNNNENSLFNFIDANHASESELLKQQFREFIKTSNILENNFYPHPFNNNLKHEHNIKPKYIYVTITDKCNLNCIYCYAKERKDQPDNNLNNWLKYIDDILSFNNECTFVFTGGEPLIAQNIFQLASYIKSKNCQNILLTNGTQINTKEIAQKVVDLFSDIRISLDSLDELINSKLRGNNLVSDIIKAYELLKSCNANVRILSTVNSLTKDDVESFADFFDNNVVFQPFYEMGLGRIHNNLSLTGEEYYNSLTKTDVFKYLQGFHKNIHNYRNRPFKRCAFAVEEISLDSSGNIFPCHMLHYENLNCGNLNTKKFEEIYCNSTILKELRNINVDSMIQCKECIFRNICGGACRARVDITKNGISGINSFCEFEKKSILDALLYSYG
jgi:radical SAM protein with 4Fe4S-binding SPASM domain